MVHCMEVTRVGECSPSSPARYFHGERVMKDLVVLSLKDDGDTLELGHGQTLRLRVEVDEDYSINDYDSDGKTAWGTRDGDTGYERRPEGFTGAAEKLGIYDHGVSLWWQPYDLKNMSIRPGTPEWKQERARIRDLAEYGFKIVTLEVLEGEDAYGRPIVVKAASCGGVDALYPELLLELFSELEASPMG